MAVSRWMPDSTCDRDGFHVFLRDLEDGFVWSAGFQPTRAVPDSYEFQFSTSAAEISRTDRGIECRLAVCVAPEHDIELRRCRLTNHGSNPRWIELTSYVEFVLASREADAHHPVFSKLFIETEFWPERSTILARRRPRSSEEPERWGFHRLLTDANQSVGDVQFETHRAAFIGRGRSLAHPRALDHEVQLTGEQGAVLDPIGSLRTAVSLRPGETREVVFLLGAAQGRQAIEGLVTAADDSAAAGAIFAAVEESAAAGNGETSRWMAHPPHDGLEDRLREVESRRLYLPASAVVTEVELPQLQQQEAIQFENSYGGFSADGREYVLRLEPDAEGQLRLPPQPWTNVLANEQAGCLVTERGAGYTWVGNSRHNRLSAWNNDPLCDPHAEALWIRDEEAGVFWSPTPGPMPAEAPYEVRHGFGATTFRHTSLGLAQEVTMFMAPDDPVKLVRLRLENGGQTSRRLTVFSYLQWCLGTLAAEADAITTEFDETLPAILARNPGHDVHRDSVAVSAVAMADAAIAPDVSYTGDRETFLGRYGDLAAPAAVAEGQRLDNRTGSGLDPCAAWQVPVEVPAGSTLECTFLLGEATDRDAGPRSFASIALPARCSGRWNKSRHFGVTRCQPSKSKRPIARSTCWSTAGCRTRT
jgi:cyclic beta-1,2-glucan synthetase